MDHHTYQCPLETKSSKNRPVSKTRFLRSENKSFVEIVKKAVPSNRGLFEIFRDLGPLIGAALPP